MCTSRKNDVFTMSEVQFQKEGTICCSRSEQISKCNHRTKPTDVHIMHVKICNRTIHDGLYCSKSFLLHTRVGCAPRRVTSQSTNSTTQRKVAYVQCNMQTLHTHEPTWKLKSHLSSVAFPLLNPNAPVLHQCQSSHLLAQQQPLRWATQSSRVRRLSLCACSKTPP